MLGTPLTKVCVVGTKSDFVESLFWLHENEPYSLFSGGMLGLTFCFLSCIN